jgi:hypothetical protein
VLFSSPATASVADDILKEFPKFMKKGEISWGKFEDGKLQFPAFVIVLGFPNLFIKNVESIRLRDVVFVASFLDHVELLSQLSGTHSLL